MTSSKKNETPVDVKVNLPVPDASLSTYGAYEQDGKKYILIGEELFLVLDEDEENVLSESVQNHLDENCNGTKNIVNSDNTLGSKRPLFNDSIHVSADLNNKKGSFAGANKIAYRKKRLEIKSSNASQDDNDRSFNHAATFLINDKNTNLKITETVTENNLTDVIRQQECLNNINCESDGTVLEYLIDKNIQCKLDSLEQSDSFVKKCTNQPITILEPNGCANSIDLTSKPFTENAVVDLNTCLTQGSYKSEKVSVKQVASNIKNNYSAENLEYDINKEFFYEASVDNRLSINESCHSQSVNETQLCKVASRLSGDTEIILETVNSLNFSCVDNSHSQSVNIPIPSAHIITEETLEAVSNSVFNFGSALNEIGSVGCGRSYFVSDQKELVFQLINKYKDTDSEHLELLAKKKKFPYITNGSRKSIKKMKDKLKYVNANSKKSSKKSFFKSKDSKIRDKSRKRKSKMNKSSKFSNNVAHEKSVIHSQLIKKFKLKEVKVLLERLDIHSNHINRIKEKIEDNDSLSNNQINTVCKEVKLKLKLLRKPVKNELLVDVNRNKNDLPKLNCSSAKDLSITNKKLKRTVSHRKLEFYANLHNNSDLPRIILPKLQKLSDFYDVMIKHRVKTVNIPNQVRGSLEQDEKEESEHSNLNIAYFSDTNFGTKKRKNLIIENECKKFDQFSYSLLEISPKPVHNFFTKRIRNQVNRESAIERYKKKRMLKKLSINDKKIMENTSENLQKENSFKVENSSTDSKKLLPLHPSNGKITEGTVVESVQKQFLLQKERDKMLDANGEKKNLQKNILLNKENDEKLGSNLTLLDNSKDIFLHGENQKLNANLPKSCGDSLNSLPSDTKESNVSSYKKSNLNNKNGKKMIGIISETKSKSNENFEKLENLNENHVDCFSNQTSLQRENDNRLHFNSVSDNFEKQKMILHSKSNRNTKDTLKRTERLIVSTSLWGAPLSRKRIKTNQGGSIKKNPFKEKTLTKEMIRGKYERKIKLHLNTAIKVRPGKFFKSEIKDTKDHPNKPSNGFTNFQISTTTTTRVPLNNCELQERLGGHIKEEAVKKLEISNFHEYKCNCSQKSNLISQRCKKICQRERRNTKKVDKQGVHRTCQTNKYTESFKQDLMLQSKVSLSLKKIKEGNRKKYLENDLRSNRTSLLDSTEGENQKLAKSS